MKTILLTLTIITFYIALMYLNVTSAKGAVYNFNFYNSGSETDNNEKSNDLIKKNNSNGKRNIKENVKRLPNYTRNEESQKKIKRESEQFLQRLTIHMR